jgi:ESX-1-secreted protein regulator
MTDASQPPQTLAQRLSRLRATTAPPGQRLPTTRSLAQQVSDAGHPVSHAYIARLLNGQADDPSLACLRALAKVFHVPLSYLVAAEASEPQDTDPDLLVAMQDEHIRLIALAAKGLTNESLETVLNVINRVRALEGLTGGALTSTAENRSCGAIPGRRQLHCG